MAAESESAEVGETRRGRTKGIIWWVKSPRAVESRHMTMKHLLIFCGALLCLSPVQAQTRVFRTPDPARWIQITAQVTSQSEGNRLGTLAVRTPSGKNMTFSYFPNISAVKYNMRVGSNVRVFYSTYNGDATELVALLVTSC
jgi:hypothetical protein